MRHLSKQEVRELLGKYNFFDTQKPSHFSSVGDLQYLSGIEAFDEQLRKSYPGSPHTISLDVHPKGLQITLSEGTFISRVALFKENIQYFSIDKQKPGNKPDNTVIVGTQIEGKERVLIFGVSDKNKANVEALFYENFNS